MTAARAAVEVTVRELGPSLPGGDGDDDQDDEEPGPVASSTSDATGRDARRSMPAFRSVVSVLVRFVMPPISGKW